MSKFIFGIFDVTEQHEKDFMADAGVHPFIISFHIDELNGDEEHFEIMSTTYGLDSSITDNEDTENSFSVLIDDFPTKKDVIEYLESKGGMFDPDFF